MTYEAAMHQWRDGERRLEEAPADRQRVLDRVSGEILEELRRRLGGAFTVDELVALYEQGTGWAEGLAMRVAPEDPWAWDSRLVVDAAFARYVRGATDFAGGRRLTPDG